MYIIRLHVYIQMYIHTGFRVHVLGSYRGYIVYRKNTEKHYTVVRGMALKLGTTMKVSFGD